MDENMNQTNSKKKMIIMLLVLSLIFLSTGFLLMNSSSKTDNKEKEESNTNNVEIEDKDNNKPNDENEDISKNEDEEKEENELEKEEENKDSDTKDDVKPLDNEKTNTKPQTETKPKTDQKPNTNTKPSTNTEIKTNEDNKTIVEVKKYTITFNTDGGSTISSQIVNENGVVTRPNNPTKDGYTFDNWYLGNEVYNFNTKVTKNITLTAHWKKNKIDVDSVSLDKTSYSMLVGDTVVLNATVLPFNATDKTVRWSSSNSAIATVTNGTVKAISAGVVTITATVDGKEATCTITVKNPVTYSYEIKDASGSTTGQVYIYIKSSEGNYVDGSLTIIYKNGGEETVNIPAS